MTTDKKTTSKLRIGQLGVGYWGPNLLRNVVSSERAEMSLVVDLDESRRAWVTKEFPTVKVSSNPEDLLKGDVVDAIVIATPAKTHFALAKAALENGKHVLVEKPMALSSREVTELGGIASAKGLTAMVGHTFLFDNNVRYLKQLVDSGALGQLRYIYSQRLNLGRIRPDVDALWNLAPHDISIIQYILGDPSPAKVQRQGMSYVQPGIDDVVFLNISYANRVMANVHVSWLDPQRVRKFVLVGSDRMAVFDDTLKSDKISVFDKGIDKMHQSGVEMHFDSKTRIEYSHRSGKVFTPKIPQSEPLAQELSHFFDCVEGKAECLTGPLHAGRVVEVLEAATPQTLIMEVDSPLPQFIESAGVEFDSGMGVPAVGSFRTL